SLVLNLAVCVEVTRGIFQAIIRTVVNRKERKTETSAQNEIMLERRRESESRRNVTVGRLDSRSSSGLLRTRNTRPPDYPSRLIVIRDAISALNEGREDVVPQSEI